MLEINKIILHCSDSPDNRDDTAADIHAWHIMRGWDGIGYHWVIRRSGKLEAGRPEYWHGAHTRGQNFKSVGVCLIGRDSFTESQFRTLDRLLRQLLKRYSKATIHGHNEYDSNKTCPNFDVGRVVDRLEACEEI